MRGLSNTTNSLAHMKRKCQYHIVFTPKYPSQIKLSHGATEDFFVAFRVTVITTACG